MARLTYKTWQSPNDPSDFADQDILNGAVKVIALAYGVNEKSVPSLLQNGWSQYIQDSFAGPRAKAIKDGESEATVAAVVQAAADNRRQAIIDGTHAANTTGGQGRDPIKSVAKFLIEEGARKAGLVLPTNPVKLKLIVDQWLAKPGNMDRVNAEIAKRKAEKAAQVTVDVEQFANL